ncbi:SusC/RagA family TonB-linked outer membrane protein [Gemmatimonadetes bacterium T265]|nr:SusC/RagA family TonB-linked outer membrane protein [Gemmatimonadetes bacterium T265]
MRQLRTLLPTAAALVASAAVARQAQAQRRVTGTVTTATGEGTPTPLAGATVQIVGTTIGTYTNDAGRFTVQVPAGAQVIRIRRIGYQARTIPVAAAVTDLGSVSLAKDVLQLETQVVTGQATSVSSRNVANAVTVVQAAEVNRVAQPTVENALQGKVPGAVITQNGGAPGGGVQVQIRGSNTVNGNYQPLYVVDGVIVSNDAIQTGLNSITGAGTGVVTSQDQQVNRIADLNPQDIESIEILKGPSGGAIYGSRGANGVIVITTKRGQSGTPAVDAIGRLGTQSLANKYDMRCFTYDQAVAEAKADFNITLTPQDYAGCVDPQETLYGNHYTSYEASGQVRGGSPTTTYFVSGLAKRDAGLATNTGFDKQSLRLNLTQALGTSVNLRASSEILHTLTERGISGNDNNNIAPYTILGQTPTYFDYRRRDALTGQLVSDPFVGGGANALQDQQAIQTPENVYRLIGNASADWSILAREKQTLSFNVLGGIDAYADRGRIYSPPFTYIEQSKNISPYPGTVVENNSNVANANLNASLVHRAVLGFATATTSVGTRDEYGDFRQATNLGRGLLTGVTNFTTAIQTNAYQQQTTQRTFSFYAQEEFLTAAERLLLTAAVNGERSSTNGDSAKFYYYPKFSASYNLPFLPHGVDNFKLRLAYGQAGNRVPLNYKYTFLQQLPENGIVGLRPAATIGLSTIFPEVTTETEGGFDVQFFGGRAGGDFTLYHKVTHDLVLQTGLAPSTGFTLLDINGGRLRNNGVEVGLNLLPVQSKAFTWQSRTTFSRNRSFVLSLPVPAFNTGSGFGERTAVVKVQQGYPVDGVYAYNGFNANGSRHEQYFGSASPDFTMGFSNDFTFGPVRLSALLDWRKGGYLANLSQTYLEQGVNGQSGITGGNFADTAMNNRDQLAYKNGIPAFLEHGSFAKLREVTVSYALGKRVSNTLSRGLARDVRLELSGRNLATITHYRGLDPEVSNFGNSPLNRLWDLAPYPPSRQFFFSVNSSF